MSNLKHQFEILVENALRRTLKRFGNYEMQVSTT